MISAKKVAKYFLCLSDPEVGDSISNLKLQKLLYYAQGFHLAIFEKPLFEDKILAWEHGPVVEDIYHKYKSYGNQGIEIPNNLNFEEFHSDIRELLDEIYEMYGQFSAWKLRNMTHSEPPWTQTKKNEEITLDRLKKYFETQVN